MKTTTYIALAASIIALASCQEEEFGYTARDINYQSEFVKAFGTPEVGHTWSTVNTCSLDFTLPEEGNYTIYVTSQYPGYPDTNYLLGMKHLQNASGAQQIRFDIPRGVDAAYLSVLADDAQYAQTQMILVEGNMAEVSSAATPTATTAQSLELTNFASRYIMVQFEDLGGTCDWDFNDVMINLSVVSQPSPSFMIAIMNVSKVGGTLPVELVYDGNPLSFNVVGSTSGETATELHAAYGYDTNCRINVKPNGEVSAEEAELYKSSNYSLTQTLTTTSSDGTLSDIVSRISLRVNGTNQGVTIISANQSKSSVPQALVLQNFHVNTKEGQSIAEVYPQFTNWVADSNYQWYQWGWVVAANQNPTLQVADDDEEEPGKAEAGRR